MRLRVLAPTIALSVALLGAITAAPALALSCPPASGGTQSCGSETIGTTHIQAWVGPAGGGPVRSAHITPKRSPKAPVTVQAAAWNTVDEAGPASALLLGGVLFASAGARRRYARIASLTEL